MEAEFIKAVKDLSPLTLALVVLFYALRKLPAYSLEKMKLETAEKERILVHLNEQVDRLTEELQEMKKELNDYRKRFFKLEADYQRLKNEYDELKGELERHEQKEAQR